VRNKHAMHSDRKGPCLASLIRARNHTFRSTYAKLERPGANITLRTLIQLERVLGTR